jgi:hypothetical protein
MSGMFSGDEVSSDVAADGFYQKGSGILPLLKIIEGLSRTKHVSAKKAATTGLFWIQRSGNDADGEPYVVIDCPNCLRTFRQSVGGYLSPIREALCVHCQNLIYYAIVEPVDWAPRKNLQTQLHKTGSASQPSFITESRRKSYPNVQYHRADHFLTRAG